MHRRSTALLVSYLFILHPPIKDTCMINS